VGVAGTELNLFPSVATQFQTNRFFSPRTAEVRVVYQLRCQHDLVMMRHIGLEGLEYKIGSLHPIKDAIFSKTYLRCLNAYTNGIFGTLTMALDGAGAITNGESAMPPLSDSVIIPSIEKKRAEL